MKDASDVLTLITENGKTILLCTACKEADDGSDFGFNLASTYRSHPAPVTNLVPELSVKELKALHAAIEEDISQRALKGDQEAFALMVAKAMRQAGTQVTPPSVDSNKRRATSAERAASVPRVIWRVSSYPDFTDVTPALITSRQKREGFSDAALGAQDRLRKQLDRALAMSGANSTRDIDIFRAAFSDLYNQKRGHFRFALATTLAHYFAGYMNDVYHGVTKSDRSALTECLNDYISKSTNNSSAEVPTLTFKFGSGRVLSFDV